MGLNCFTRVHFLLSSKTKQNKTTPPGKQTLCRNPSIPSVILKLILEINLHFKSRGLNLL